MAMLGGALLLLATIVALKHAYIILTQKDHE